MYLCHAVLSRLRRWWSSDETGDDQVHTMWLLDALLLVR